MNTLLRGFSCALRASVGKIATKRSVVHPVLAASLHNVRSTAFRSSADDIRNACNSMNTTRALQQFEGLPSRAVFHYNLLLQMLSKQGDVSRSLQLLERMNSEGLVPNRFTVLPIFWLAVSTGNVQVASLLPDLMRSARCMNDVEVLATAVYAYAKCKMPQEALQLFESIPVKQRTVKIYSNIFAALSVSKHFSRRVPAILDDMLLSMRVVPDSQTIQMLIRSGSVLQDSEFARRIWALATKIGCDKEPRILSSMIDMFGKCACAFEARAVFDSMKPFDRDTVVWNSLISAYSYEPCLARKVPEILNEMLVTTTLNNVTPLILLRAATSEQDVELGKRALALADKQGYSKEPRILTTAIEMFGKCGYPEEALRVFANISSDSRTVYTWTALMSALSSDHTYAAKVPLLLEEMLSSGITPDPAFLVVLLGAASMAKDIKLGEKAWEMARGLQCQNDPRLLNAMIDMYGKCGCPEQALRTFQTLSSEFHSVFSWTSLMLAHSFDIQHAVQVPSFLRQMQESRVSVNSTTVLVLLRAAAVLSDVGLGETALSFAGQLHCNEDPWVVSAAIKMFGKCGHPERARTLFDSLESPSSSAYSSMISAYGVDGQVSQALDLFNLSLSARVPTTGLMAVSILQTLSQTQQVVEALSIYSKFPSDIKTLPDVVAAYVDCLARAKRLEEAEAALTLCPNNIIALRSVLGACRFYVDVTRAVRIFDRIVAIDPANVESYILLANTYGQAKQWDKRGEVMARVRALGLKKVPGVSTAMVDGNPENFYAHHSGHPRQTEIEAEMEKLQRDLLHDGHVPDLSWVTQEYATREEEEAALCRHSERYAIAYSILMEQKEITITNNIRVCGDCHSTTARIASIRNIRIYLRDSSRWHHFSPDGTCSCGNNW